MGNRGEMMPQALKVGLDVGIYGRLATRQVKIGTAVLVIPYRNSVLLGRMLVTLDVLPGGVRWGACLTPDG